MVIVHSLSNGCDGATMRAALLVVRTIIIIIILTQRYNYSVNKK